MAVTFRTSAAGGGTSGTGNRTATIAALTGDLLIVYVQWSTNSATNPTCTDNGTGTNTYSLIGTALNNGSADICALFIRNAAVAANATLTITPVVGSGTNTAGEIVIIACSGATNFGASALRSVSGTPQFGKQANQTTGVPTPVLPAAALTGNMTLMSCGSSTTAGSVPNASWTERQDASQINPTTSMEVATRDSGFTGTSAAYVSVASAVWNSMIIELDGAVNVTVPLTGRSATFTPGTVGVTADVSVAQTGQVLTSSAGTVTVTAGTDVSVALTGQSVSSAPGTVTPTGTASVDLTGAALASTPGVLGMTGDANLTLAGQSLTSTPGSVDATADVSFDAVGALLTSTPGSVTVDTTGPGVDVTVDLVGMALSSALGTLALTGDANLTLSGKLSSFTFGHATITTTGGGGTTIHGQTHISLGFGGGGGFF